MLELLLAVVMMSVLLGVAIDRLIFLQIRAERIAMEQMVGIMRSGLYIRVAELLARNELAQIPALADSNPVERLAQPPPNYRGELFGPDPASIERGNWYFDSRDRLLVYVVDNVDAFDTALPPPPRARFRVVLVFDDLNKDGRYDAGVDSLRGVRLTEAEPFTWRDGVSWPTWPWESAATARSVSGR